MSNNLALITHDYPLNKGDTAFIASEIDTLSREFDSVFVLCLSTESENKVTIPNNCTVYFMEGKKDKCHYLNTALSLPFRTNIQYLKEEIADLKSRNKASIKNYLIAIKYYLKAISICNRIEQISLEKSIPNLVYSFWSGPEVLATIMLNEGKTICARAHGYDLYEERTPTLYQPFKMVIDRRINIMLFISNQGMNYYLNKYATGSHCKYYVSYLGCKGRREYTSLFAMNGTLELLSISAVIPLKRIEMIINALNLLDTEIKVHWTHIGGGEQLDRIKYLAMDILSEKTNVSYVFLGNMQHEDVIHFLDGHNFHVLINCSSTEGLPVSMMEALSYSIPIIGTDVGGVSEIVDETDGLLLPFNSKAKDYAVAIEKIAKLDKISYERLRKGAYYKWTKLFNADVNYISLAEKLKLSTETNCDS